MFPFAFALYFTLYIGSLKNFITIIHSHAWNVFLRSFEQCQEDKQYGKAIGW